MKYLNLIMIFIKIFKDKSHIIVTYQLNFSQPQIKEYKKKIFKILDAETYEDAESLFNSLLKEKNNIPYKLKKFVDKDLKHGFERYMVYLKDENIEKTTNKLENFYRQTFSRAIKKLLTSVKGKKDFLSIRNHNWNKKFGKVAYQLNFT